MMNAKKPVSVVVAIAAAATVFAVAVPAATAEETETVTSSRSFPKVTAVKKDLLSEATSINVDENSQWGGIEQLDVPQTKSPAEIEAENAARQAEENARSAAASRSQARESLSTTSSSSSQSTPSSSSSVTAPSGSNGAAVVAYASQFVGAPYVWGGSSPSGWDCSGFVMYVFAQFGISLPHSSGAMMSYGSPVSSLAEAMPGDIIANSAHVGIYVGNGMVINALNPRRGTDYSAVSTSFSGSYVIRRLL